jgi:hypothetical protein
MRSVRYAHVSVSNGKSTAEYIVVDPPWCDIILVSFAAILTEYFRFVDVCYLPARNVQRPDYGSGGGPSTPSAPAMKDCRICQLMSSLRASRLPLKLP